ncbi:MAG: mechanosensitive ion channel family protein [bacterium]|nr:mechanosensitive ion channel family protein [bacterium]
MEYLSDLLRHLPLWQVLAYCVGGAVVLQFVVLRVISLLTRRTETQLDDQIIRAIRVPLLLTLLFVAASVVLRRVLLPEGEGVYVWEHAAISYVIAVRVLSTLALWIWFRALSKVSDSVLEAMARRVDQAAWIEPRTLPLFELTAKLALVGALIFAFLKIWNLDPSAWLASAGILGLAVGFAAKDTLANLFAGLFIIADAPYQLGDFIVLGTGERGRVTDIGLRSTRILTRDDVEVTIPNSVMANTKIVNETQGPAPKRRVRVDVGVSYTADLDQVKDELIAVAAACDYIEDDPKPSARVRSLGDSAITVQLRGYIKEPYLRGRAVDALLTGAHKRLAAAGIEIPFPQRVVHMSPGSP